MRGEPGNARARPLAAGAYGLRIEGLDEVARWMPAVPADAPLLRVSAVVGPASDAPTYMDEQTADVALLGGGRMRARRGGEAVEFGMPELPSPADLLHPFLAPAAAITWRWLGEEALHAGVVQIGDIAVLLFGAKEAGKSTTLTWLAQHAETPVLSDDLAIVVGRRVFAGPRSIDLRAASWVPPDLPSVRGGDRVRLALGPAPPSLPVGGSVFLEWGPRDALMTMPPAARLGALGRQRMFARLATDEMALLDLAALPTFTLVRPRAIEGVESTARAIIERFSAGGGEPAHDGLGASSS